MPAQNQPPPLPNGTALNKGRYTIEKWLGGGGFGHVYLARDAKQQAFAVKQCTDLSKEAVTQFGHEIAVLKMLASQSSMYPQVYEQFEEDFPGGLSYAFAVMEFVAGRTLESMIEERVALRQGGFAEPEVLTWATQLLETLEYTHNKGIIHRDVKPGNIMLLPDGKQIKIIDVGIAKIGGAGTKTQRGAAAASAHFAPPEQYAQAGQTDRVSDIYAAGATMYVLLTLTHPTEAPTRMGGGQPLIPPRRINPQISQQTENVILHALELNVGNRYQTAAEMLAALQGKTQMATQVCPNCTAINQATARFCSTCGHSFQGQFLLLAGARVQAVTDLPAACDRAWIEAIGYLTTGKIDQWLQTAGPNGQTWAAGLQAVRSHYPMDPHLQLDAFLRQLDPQRPLPQLHVQPLPTTPTIIEQGAAHSVPLTLLNNGGGMLVGSLRAIDPWVAIQPTTVQLLAGQSQTVTARLDTTPLAGNRNGALYAGQVMIQTNGGSQNLALQVQVMAAPRLSVQPLQLDFGEVRPGQTPVRAVQIANDGAGALQAQVQSSVPWLQFSPMQMTVQARMRQNVTIQALTRQMGQRGQYDGEIYIDAGADGSAAIKATLRLAGPVSLSCDPSTAINTVEQLIGWCDAHWSDAIQLLRSGELHAAARYLGEPTKGLFRRRNSDPWPVALGKVQQAAGQRDLNLGLENALRALGAEPPTYSHNWSALQRQLGLGLIPDVRWMIPWWHGPPTVDLHIKNEGRGYLHGRLVSRVGWLVVDPGNQVFGCLPGQRAVVRIRVLKQQRRLKGWRPALFDLHLE